MTFDEQIAARTIYGEARGEVEQGQRAVAYVIVNRLRFGRWGAKFAGVCLAPLQFSCWNANDLNRILMVNLPEDHPLLAKFITFIGNALSDPDGDPTFGALNYYALSIEEPGWAKGKRFVDIGRHRFVRG